MAREFEFTRLTPVEINFTTRDNVHRRPRHKPASFVPQPRTCHFINETEDQEAIPPHAVIQPKDHDDSGCIVDVDGEPYIRAIKPNDEPCEVYYINGPLPVEYGQVGQCVLAAEIPTKVLIDPDADPEFLDTFGPVDDEWHLAASGTGYLWLGLTDEDEGTAIFREGSPPDGVLFRNDASETMPAYGVGRITGDEDVAGKGDVTKIAKPDTTFSRLYLINGGSDVAAGAYGFGYLMDGQKRRALYDSGTPAYGEGWGPKPSQWSLSKGYYGFTVFANNDTSALTTYVSGMPINTVFGKLDAALGDGETETVSVWATAGGTEEDTTMNITGEDWFMKSGATDIASGKKVKLDWMGNAWYFTLAECA